MAGSDICNIRFHISDQDDAGTNIRSQPNGNVILIIPKAKETNHNIYASRLMGSWWKISKIVLEGGAEMEINDAWIHQSVVGTGLDDGRS